MTHYYNEWEQDCYNCDSCGNEIIGDIYNKHGNTKRSKYWKNDEHYHKECLE